MLIGFMLAPAANVAIIVQATPIFAVRDRDILLCVIVILCNILLLVCRLRGIFVSIDGRRQLHGTSQFG